MKNTAQPLSGQLLRNHRCHLLLVARFAFVTIALIGLLALTPATNAQADTPIMREGDNVIETNLRDVNNEPVSLTSPDRPTLITFIFTRCAAMEFCPRMNARFEALQSSATHPDTPKFRLLSITLDPEHDRPERLKEFSKVINADPDVWNFATGSKEEIDRLTKAFRVFRESKDGTINHTLCTALIRPDGTIAKIWRGNFWEVEDALATLRNL